MICFILKIKIIVKHIIGFLFVQLVVYKQLTIMILPKIQLFHIFLSKRLPHHFKCKYLLILQFRIFCKHSCLLQILFLFRTVRYAVIVCGQKNSCQKDSRCHYENCSYFCRFFITHNILNARFHTAIPKRRRDSKMTLLCD